MISDLLSEIGEVVAKRKSVLSHKVGVVKTGSEKTANSATFPGEGEAHHLTPVLKSWPLR